MNIPSLQLISSNLKKFCAPQTFQKLYPDFYTYIMDHMYGDNFSEKLYNYYHPDCIHVCTVCEQKVKYINFNKGYQKYCSRKCCNSDEIKKEKIKQTNIEKYGVENISQSDIVKEKKIQTSLLHFGTKYPTQNNTVKEKTKQICLYKFGGYPMQNEHIKKKSIQSTFKKYGVKYPTQNKIIKEKVRDSFRQYHINTINDLIGYADNGDWICKCPHSNTCNQCTEKIYITNSSIYDNRLSYRCELCTKLFPIGSKESGVSNASKVYFNQLKQYFPDLITEYPLGKYKLDCYIPSLRIDIEYNGVYWHAKPTLYNSTDILNFYEVHKTAQEIWNHDNERQKYIESKGIKVITLWEDDLPDPKELINTPIEAL